jgi:hypothetical protein
MEKKLLDYAAYYIGCPCVNTWFPEDHDCYNAGWKLDGVRLSSIKPYILENATDTTSTNSIKFILRKLESITEVEAKEMQNELLPGWGQKYPTHWHHEEMLSFITGSMRPTLTPSGAFNCTHYLLNRYFDLYNLIESGLAIDAATLPK